MPSLVVDGLLVAGVGAGIALLGTALEARELGRLPTFPSLLLWVLLLRFGVSLAALRLLLTQGSAGRVVDLLGAVGAGVG